jgi:hypothetical protein
MPGLGLGLSISARNAITAGSSAPSGIVVATTTNVIVTFGGTSGLNYTRDSYPIFTQYVAIEPAPGIASCSLTFDLAAANTWVLQQISSGEEGGLVIEARNPSANGLIIPTTGWTYNLGTGPTVTITAA